MKNKYKNFKKSKYFKFSNTFTTYPFIFIYLITQFCTTFTLSFSQSLEAPHVENENDHRENEKIDYLLQYNKLLQTRESLYTHKTHQSSRRDANQSSEVSKAQPSEKYNFLPVEKIYMQSTINRSLYLARWKLMNDGQNEHVARLLNNILDLEIGINPISKGKIQKAKNILDSYNEPFSSLFWKNWWDGEVRFPLNHFISKVAHGFSDLMNDPKNNYQNIKAFLSALEVQYLLNEAIMSNRIYIRKETNELDLLDKLFQSHFFPGFENKGKIIYPDPKDYSFDHYSLNEANLVRADYFDSVKIETLLNKNQEPLLWSIFQIVKEAMPEVPPLNWVKSTLSLFEKWKKSNEALQNKIEFVHNERTLLLQLIADPGSVELDPQLRDFSKKIRLELTLDTLNDVDLQLVHKYFNENCQLIENNSADKNRESYRIDSHCLGFIEQSTPLENSNGGKSTQFSGSTQSFQELIIERNKIDNSGIIKISTSLFGIDFWRFRLLEISLKLLRSYNRMTPIMDKAHDFFQIVLTSITDWSSQALNSSIASESLLAGDLRSYHRGLKLYTAGFINFIDHKVKQIGLNGLKQGMNHFFDRHPLIKNFTTKGNEAITKGYVVHFIVGLCIAFESTSYYLKTKNLHGYQLDVERNLFFGQLSEQFVYLISTFDFPYYKSKALEIFNNEVKTKTLETLKSLNSLEKPISSSSRLNEIVKIKKEASKNWSNHLLKAIDENNTLLTKTHFLKNIVKYLAQSKIITALTTLGEIQALNDLFYSLNLTPAKSATYYAKGWSKLRDYWIHFTSEDLSLFDKYLREFEENRGLMSRNQIASKNEQDLFKDIIDDIRKQITYETNKTDVEFKAQDNDEESFKLKLMDYMSSKSQGYLTSLYMIHTNSPSGTLKESEYIPYYEKYIDILRDISNEILNKNETIK